ncbi:MAG: AbrB/MazE/SpoVT family DNA-binding domain-containing protein [Oscillospiraceae bacterium]|nr:AbrB/MazE/SpoVT family DNA-binding domain-containing protein [Oscillospiraceae bacterium]
MKSSGMVRPVDRMGRVVIPKEIRRQLKVENDKDSFEIFLDDDKIILKKFAPTCMFCDTLLDTIQVDGHVICKNCIERLYALKDQID